jgi:hypothetical protein
MCLFKRRRIKEKKDYKTKRAVRHINSWELAYLEVCLTAPFLDLSKVLIYGPSRIPVLGHLCIPKVRRILSSEDAVRVKLSIILRGRFLGLY